MFEKTIMVTLTPVDCPTCHCWFGVDEAHRSRLALNNKSFYCPNGHSMSYTENELDKVKRHLKFAERDAENARAAAERERRDKITARAALTRTKNRIARGICPCCNRSFTNVQRHISGQHPEYDTSVKTTLSPLDSKINARQDAKDSERSII